MFMLLGSCLNILLEGSRELFFWTKCQISELKDFGTLVSCFHSTHFFFNRLMPYVRFECSGCGR